MQCASQKQGRSPVCKRRGGVHSSDGDGDGDSFGGGYAGGDAEATRGFGMIETSLEGEPQVGSKELRMQRHKVT